MRMYGLTCLLPSAQRACDTLAHKKRAAEFQGSKTALQEPEHAFFRVLVSNTQVHDVLGFTCACGVQVHSLVFASSGALLLCCVDRSSQLADLRQRMRAAFPGAFQWLAARLTALVAPHLSVYISLLFLLPSSPRTFLYVSQ